MGAFFWLVFGAGKYLETPLLAVFDKLGAWAAAMVPPESAAGAILQGTILGISGGLGIVLPYLVPFLVGLAALEDSGYLPRMAYLLDGVMHRLGLHGKSVVPLVLGYGCSVPAVMATRILESPRDRRVTATLAILIPCSARSTVILGLVGAQLGALAAIAVYVVNLVVTAGLAMVLERKTAAASPGLILEVPDLRAPSGKTVFTRAWIAIREFLAIAWPMLIASSIVLSLLQISGAEAVINRGLSPLTVTLLGLPLAVGTTIVFGVLRKELSLMMLVQALGTTAVATVMTPAQMITFALFVVFYVPCVATLAVLWRELGWKETAWIGGMTVVLATAVAMAGRFATGAFY
jgi:ferrous iron transport protein B